jgi:CheY-like chemotaxis protein
VKPSEPELAPGRPTPTGVVVTPAALAGRSVLVVDDEEDARELVATVLEGAGARVETARSVAETLAILERSRPDALVSDIAMPAEDGYTLIQKVRSLPGRADLPVLALTAYARDEDRATALRAGFDGHLGKPTDPGALVAMLVEVTKRRERAPA